jgi:dihydrodipicolinate synthase/N-acetylneuraminate lyase
VLRGTLAAALTPLRDRGAAVDEAAFAPYVDFLAAAGLDGLLALGTTGEGVLLAPGERRRVAELFLEAARGRLDLAVHCGAQTTADTVALAAHAAEAGATAVAVISPPYFPLDDRALLAHLAEAARACAPLPFYVYEFADRSGYPVAPAVLAQLREEAPNLAGLKVSDAPWERFAPYLIEGLDVFVGPEALIVRGLAAGAAGVVSGLAASFPAEVVALAGGRDEAGSARVASLRSALNQLPFQAASKAAVASRGVPMREDVRAPLRGLTPEERADLEQLLERYK